MRKALDLTQQAFADRIGSKRTTIAKYETETNIPSSVVISLICREFRVSKTWFRTGEGEMFRLRTREDERSAFMDELLAEENSGFRRRLATSLSRLSPRWDALEAVALNLLNEPSAKSPQEMTGEEREPAPAG